MNNLIKQKEIEIIELKIKKLELDVDILKDVDEELFKRIDGYDNYFVSNFGNVKNSKTNKNIKQSNHRQGYKKIGLTKNGKQKHFYVHRLVGIAFLENPGKKEMIDHIDENKANNNLKNLRWATNQDNQFNLGISKNNTSGYKGISYNKKLNKYKARICINRISQFLGYFETAEKASKAYEAKAKILHGEFFYKNK